MSSWFKIKRVGVLKREKVTEKSHRKERKKTYVIGNKTDIVIN